VENLKALVGQQNLLDAPVARIFQAQDQSLPHQPVEHLAGSGAGHAQVVAKIGHATAPGAI
jgi:hypothetical protein